MEKIAEIVENELTEHVRNLPSFIKDTTYFLNKLRLIKQPIPENYSMFCLDVRSVFEACTIVLDIRSNFSIPTEDILKMTDLVL